MKFLRNLALPYTIALGLSLAAYLVPIDDGGGWEPRVLLAAVCGIVVAWFWTSRAGAANDHPGGTWVACLAAAATPPVAVIAFFFAMCSGGGCFS